MDNLTHGLIGLTAAHLLGHSFAWSDPAVISLLAGSQAPDFDIFTILRGKLAYIKAHRSFSHSLLGSFLWAGLISGLVAIIWQDFQWLWFFWALLGTWTHIGIDFFNTHGASLAWPIQKDRKSYALLHVFDPILLALFALTYTFNLPSFSQGLAELLLLLGYMTFRFFQKQQIRKFLKIEVNPCNTQKVFIMPSLSSVGTWDFILETKETYLLGHFDPRTKSKQYLHSLTKIGVNPLLKPINETPLGQFFQNYTPFIHWAIEPHDEGFTVYLYDLRYFQDNQFIHQGTFCFDEQEILCQTYLTSYGNQIHLPY